MSEARPQIRLIAAVDQALAIGRGNALPWHLPADLRRFKALTLGHAVLMGRRTWDSIGRPLPGRRNLVLSRSSGPIAGAEVLHGIDAALALAGSQPLYVIGGGEIYTQFLPMATELCLTHVDTRIADADTWFPPFDAADWQARSESSQPADERHAFGMRFVDYTRR